VKCHICKSESSKIFGAKVLGKYEVAYFECSNCGFIQTENSYWLEESYGSAITDLDVGLVSRNIKYSELLETVIKANFKCNGRFLDYAGGYGLFVRMMRDRGFNFFRQDRYCENLFAEHFDITDLEPKPKFEAVTAFEVFEHLDNPLADIEGMLKYSDTLIFSTELIPDEEIKGPDDWWYFTPETGQHISFYSLKTLKFIAKSYSLNFYTAGSLHMFTKMKFKNNPLVVTDTTGVGSCLQPESLTQFDYEVAKELLVGSSKDALNTLEKKSKSGVNTAKEDDCDSKLRRVYAELIVNQKKREIQKAEILTIKSDLASLRLDTEKLNNCLEETGKRLIAAESQKAEALNTLSWIYSSRSWRLLRRLQGIGARIFPEGSFMRGVLGFVARVIIYILRVFRRSINALHSLSGVIESFFFRLKPKEKRKINGKSRKLVYVGHSYHNKTKSTDFLIGYLREHFELTVILDESWRGDGQAYPDLSFIDDSYVGVIFFQNLPAPDVLVSVKNNNIIFFPMYDAVVGGTYSYWKTLRGLKIVNFSSTLHKRLTGWGLDSLSVQYFPKPAEFTPGNKDEVFFWQRVTKISINEISKLFANSKIRLHLHRAIDPGQELIEPTAGQKKDLVLTESDWFETREEFNEAIKRRALFIAPREFEGIGLSFLEAMAMGKAVVSVNNPTMNEYITNGKTGYLFDLARPKAIDLSRLEKVQKNTYKYVCDGYNRWESTKPRIIDFIERP
jgi:glycosyltransferase involved in cell wall biosynthesis